jgi:polar amino acid transport system permease protein/polar amino acid transport system substrate-binding protein
MFKLNRYIELFIQSFPSLLAGLAVTLKIAIISLFLAVILGIIFGIFSISKFKILRAISNIYTYIIRGLPLMILSLFLFFGVGAALNMRVNPMIAAIIALTLNAGAFMTEIFRAGIQAVPDGQMEAARSLGLGYFKTMKKVILPQAIKIMIPSIINQFITTLKDTSILSVISIRELTLSGQIIVARNYLPFEVYSYVGFMYLAVISVLTIISKVLERKLNYGN